MDLLIIGTGDFAAIACQYFENEGKYNIVGFVVEKEYKNKDYFMGRKVYDLSIIESVFPPNNTNCFVAIVYQKLNRARTRIYKMMKEKGYSFASYVSPYAFVGENVTIGENTFVFENNTLQYNVKVGNNVVIWSGNHIGHSSVIKDNCYVSSHVCISGYSTIEEYCFLGVNSSVADNVVIPKDTILAMGAVLHKSFDKEGCILAGVPAKPLSVSVYERFNIDDKIL